MIASSSFPALQPFTSRAPHLCPSSISGRLIGVVLLLTACGGDNPLSVYGAPGRTVSVAVGQEFELTLQTVGPGEYARPSISSLAVQFLDVSLVSPYVPAGPTQRFRFQAVGQGRAILVFTHTGQDPAVTDTIDVH